MDGFSQMTALIKSTQSMMDHRWFDKSANIDKFAVFDLICWSNQLRFISSWSLIDVKSSIRIYDEEGLSNSALFTWILRKNMRLDTSEIDKKRFAVKMKFHVIECSNSFNDYWWTQTEQNTRDEGKWLKKSPQIVSEGKYKIKRNMQR